MPYFYPASPHHADVKMWCRGPILPLTTGTILAMINESRARATGFGVAFGGHLLAGCPALVTACTFTFYAQPDSTFMASCLTGTLEVILLIACLSSGVFQRDAFGAGLRIGWLAGVAAIAGGFLLIGLAALMADAGLPPWIRPAPQ